MLDAGAQAAVTLLVAPVGWGKTALLTSWYAPRRASSTAVWLTLEPGDDGGRFWSYLHAALTNELTRRHPDRSAPPAPGGIGAEIFLPRFAAAVTALPEPVVVVLDDFHTVRDPAISHGLEFLLRHCRGQLRLVIATRTEPALALHRWRLTGDLTELRTTDLALTPAESTELVARQGLELPADRLRQLHGWAEGWPAGVRLAAHALRGETDPGRCLDQPGGGHRWIMEYLNAELLAGQQPAVRELLRRTAIVDRFCPQLAAALTGRDDTDDLLNATARVTAGFLVATDDSPVWYRCHRMLGDVLHAELLRHSPDQVVRLHQAAHAWHLAEGRAPAALRHALAAGDLSGAAELASQHWPELMLCGHEETLRTALPPLPPQTAEREPFLALAYAIDQVETSGPPTPAGRSAQPSQPTAAQPAAAHLVAAAARGTFTDLAARAIDLLTATGDEDDSGPAHRARLVALTTLGGARLGLGDLTGAEQVLTEGSLAAAAAGYGCPARLCDGMLALLQAWRGQLTLATEMARAAIALPTCPGRRCAAHSAPSHLALGVVALYRDDLADAEREIDLAAFLAGAGGPPAVAALIPIVRSWLLAAAGELTRAAKILCDLDGGRQAPPARHGFLSRLRQVAEAEVAMAQGDLGGARDLLNDALSVAGGTAEDAPPVGAADPDGRLAVALARVHLLGGDPATATRMLPDWTVQTDSVSLPVRMDAGLIETVAARALGDPRRARETLERVVDLAAPQGHRQVFGHGGSPVRDLLVEHLDSGTRHRGFIGELVEASSRRHADRHRPAPGLAEPLTDRELTVLRYLQSTLSNGEIAAELFLSVNTVKTHVRNIYQKLGAPRRRDAVRRARELRLL